MMNFLRTRLHRHRRLDFLIVGAEKAGTTALFAYLRAVPGLYLPLIKELGFFDRDDRYRDGADFSTLHRWMLPAPRAALLGEATPTYLMNPHCLQRIHDYNPQMKLIAILRSPVRRAHSAWNYRRARLRDSRDFLTAVRVEIESGGDLAVARENKYRYVGAGFYAAQIREAMRLFPGSQLMLMKYEDFNRDQPAHVRAAVRFLGGPEDFELQRVRRVNVWRYQRPLAREEFDYLLPHYLADIDEVEALTGWDCADWRRFEDNAGI